LKAMMKIVDAMTTLYISAREWNKT